MSRLQRACLIAGIIGVVLIFLPLGDQWWGYRHDADLLRVVLLSLGWGAASYCFWWAFEGRWKT